MGRGVGAAAGVSDGKTSKGKKLAKYLLIPKLVPASSRATMMIVNGLILKWRTIPS